jgi:hypothetical protein
VNALAARAERRRPGLWSLSACMLSCVGVLAATLVVASGDSENVRWPIVLAPLAISLAPVLFPRRGVLLGAAVLLGLWCWLAVLSIGVFLLPALVAQLVAAVRETA